VVKLSAFTLLSPTVQGETQLPSVIPETAEFGNALVKDISYIRAELPTKQAAGLTVNGANTKYFAAEVSP
jgi:hypothetical protein